MADHSAIFYNYLVNIINQFIFVTKILFMNNNINQKESLDIIEDMIKTAREDYSSGAAYYFVLWGTIMALYSLANYFSITANNETSSLSYLLFAAGGILSYIRSKKDDKTEQAIARHDRLYMFVWSGVGICLAIIWTLAPKLGLSNIIPVSLMVYALASFTTGGTIKYTPSLIGAIICFICVVIALFVNFAQQYLVCAVAVLAVHIMPGLMMKGYYKNRKNA